MATIDGLIIDGIPHVLSDAEARLAIEALSAVATSGDYDDLLNKPSFLGNYFRGYSTLVEPTEGDLNYYITDLENGNNLPDLKDGLVLSLKHKNISRPVFVHHSRASTVVHYKNAIIPAYGYNGNITATVNPSHEILLIYSKYNEQGVEDGTGKFIAFLIGDTEDMKTVAFTGRYADLTGTPTIPTKTSDLTNDSGFIDSVKTINGSSIVGSGNITTPDTKPTGYDTADVSSKALASSANWSNVSSINITAGTWLINWGVNFPSQGSGNTGHRGAGISVESGTSAPAINMRLCTPCITQDNYTSLCSTGVRVATGNETVYLNARQTSGSSMNVAGRLRVIKIL